MKFKITAKEKAMIMKRRKVSGGGYNPMDVSPGEDEGSDKLYDTLSRAVKLRADIEHIYNEARGIVINYKIMDLTKPELNKLMRALSKLDDASESFNNLFNVLF